MYGSFDQKKLWFVKDIFEWRIIEEQGFGSANLHKMFSCTIG